MDVKTYRARTMQEALALVRRELGPEAAVLHTREVRGGLLALDRRPRSIEVAASTERERAQPVAGRDAQRSVRTDAASESDRARRRCADADRRQPMPRRWSRTTGRAARSNCSAMVEELCQPAGAAPRHDLPEALFRVFTDLIEADVDEAIWPASWSSAFAASRAAHELADAAAGQGAAWRS